jgi:hypothetical protein
MNNGNVLMAMDVASHGKNVDKKTADELLQEMSTEIKISPSDFLELLKWVINADEEIKKLKTNYKNLETDFKNHIHKNDIIAIKIKEKKEMNDIMMCHKRSNGSIKSVLFRLLKLKQITEKEALCYIIMPKHLCCEKTTINTKKITKDEDLEELEKNVHKTEPEKELSFGNK